MKQILKYYKKQLPFILLSLVFLFGQALCELSLPRLMSLIVDTGILAGNQAYIYAKGLQMLLISGLLVACSAGVSFFSARLAAKIGRDVRGAIFRKVTYLSQGAKENFSTASLITRSTGDVQQVQMASVMTLRMACFAPLMGIGGMIMAYKTSPGLSWTIALSLVMVVLILSVVMVSTLPKFKEVQKKIDRLNLIMQERLTGILVIRAFHTERAEQLRFEEANEDYRRLNLFINRFMGFLMPAMFLVMNLSAVLVVYAASGKIMAGTMQVGNLLAFIQYSMSVIMSFLFIAMMFIVIPRAMVSANRIGEVLAVTGEGASACSSDSDSISNSASGVVSASAGPKIEFKNVFFRYPDAEEDVLSDISFVAEAGKTTAFIGSTGSGKSTMVNLLPRLYDVTEGEITINGRNLQDFSLKELRDQIGYIPQKGLLFSGTIESNLLYGKESATKEELERATSVAQALDFIEEKEKGFEEPISQGGTNVSGGQKQRLSIARALVKNPPIYIFDDSFSALDYTTDGKLRAALAEYAGEATVLIVAQRINTIRNANKIVVLENGAIAGVGTHKDLLKTCKVYGEIAASQLSPEELAAAKGGM